MGRMSSLFAVSLVFVSSLFPQVPGTGSGPQLRASEGEPRLVVLLADNAGTETTDLLVPHGILKRSGRVDVLIVATGKGAVTLMPALSLVPDMTVEEFEASHPRGADAVVVPAFHSLGTDATTAFLLGQAAKGALIVSICEGAEPVARTGLLDGRTATTHWFAHDRLSQRYPKVRWVKNTRYVVDGPVMSSSGVSASVPVTLQLLEILEGQETARATATGLGLGDWRPAHDSSRFSLDLDKVWLAVGNTLWFWRHEVLVLPLVDGFDGVAVALQADAWSRTYRSRVVAQNLGGRVVSAEGVTLVTDAAIGTRPVAPPSEGPPLAALEANLAAIAERYGPSTADFVATQLEYHWRR